MSFKSIMEKRISTGLSKIYPDRACFNLFTDEYYFSNATCTVFMCSTNSFVELEPDIFKELINSYWREEQNDLHHSKYTVSYNRAVTSEDGADNFIDLQEDEDSPIPENEFFIHELKSKYADTIDRLCPIQSQIIRGIYFQQRTENEMAAILGKTQANIHYHKIKALEKLRYYFERLEPEDLEL